MEIKATDLRIGNWVQQSPINIPFKVTANLIADMQNSKIGIVGIPLTEQLLLKMGFEEFDFTYSKSPDLVISKDFEWVGIYNTHLEDDIHYDCPKYVHQLQNLYFILSGNELILQ